MTTEQVRSFIAIELPDELKRELTQLEAQLKAGGQSPVKWVDPNGIHLTLKFLGGVTANVLNDVSRVMGEAVRGISPFHLEVRELGAFPNLRRVQVIWVGVSGELDKLGQLQQRLESGLAPLGFAPEGRPFKAHLTLARVREQASPDERQKLGELIAATGFESAAAIQVEAISLMRSELTRAGAIYSRITSVPLK
ncbi:MAG: RNA 2',3'-cyclic phosphodiesterase [Chloroflexota bacterium]|nr:RNA 2',3'-cyclic phosphodiesterase [Chloroflexota bacterium]